MSTAPIAGAAATSTTATSANAPDRLENEQTIPLAEETLVVGKRAVNRGTTRVRRYMVETPVEEQADLRSESVEVERRPIDGGRPVADADFTDKVVEVAETAEGPVVSKQARVKEEVVIHKEATDRTENARDKVRREEVEVTKEPGSGTSKASWTRPDDAMEPAEPKRS